MNDHPKPKSVSVNRFLFWAGITVCVIVIAIILMPATSHAPASRSAQCANNLKQIALALHIYHDTYGCFPPAYVTDESGKRMHSWRVLILPFLDQEHLYKKYRFDEPWNGPENSKLHAEKLDVYHCPTGPDYNNLYLAVVGPNTAWPGATSRSLKDILDGTSRTILLVEHKDAQIHWMEPRDLDFDTMSFQVNDPSGKGLSSPHRHAGKYPWSEDYPYAWVGMADGSVRRLRETTDPEALRAMLTVNGGETLPEESNVP